MDALEGLEKVQDACGALGKNREVQRGWRTVKYTCRRQSLRL